MPDFSRYGRMGMDKEPDPRPERREGDPPYRCVWCQAWRCTAPLRLCDNCETEYARMAAGMPAGGPDGYPMFQGKRAGV